MDTEMGFESNFAPREAREGEPRWRFVITRHTERLPSGEVSSQGMADSQAKGRAWAGAEILKAYTSDHAKKRAFVTGKEISEASGVTSPVREDKDDAVYRTVERPGLQYDGVLGRRYRPLIDEAKRTIDEATCIEAGLPLDTDLEKVPRDLGEKLAPIRKKHQVLGVKNLIDHPEVSRRMAAGLAHALLREFDVAARYKQKREQGQESKPVKGEVILNTVTHGAFPESLFKYALVVKRPDGTRVEGLDNPLTEEFGGLIQPNESLSLDVDDPGAIPDEIPVRFEQPRLVGSQALVSLAEMRKLDAYYNEFMEQDRKDGMLIEPK